MKNKAFIIISSCPDLATAEKLSHLLVEGRLAACVSLVPGLRSVYRWQGEVCEQAEVLLIAKTGADQVANLTARLTELHPYEVAEVLALEVASGSERYLDWIGQNC